MVCGRLEARILLFAAYKMNRTQQHAYKQAIAASQITTIYEEYLYPTILRSTPGMTDVDTRNDNTRKNKRRKITTKIPTPVPNDDDDKPIRKPTNIAAKPTQHKYKPTEDASTKQTQEYDESRKEIKAYYSGLKAQLLIIIATMNSNTNKKMTAKTTAYQKNRTQRKAYKQAIAASQITTIYEEHLYPTILRSTPGMTDVDTRNTDTRKNKRRKTTTTPVTNTNRRLGIAPTTPPTPQTDAHHKPRTRPKNRKTTKNSYKAFVAFQSIGIAMTQKIPPWNRTNEFVGAPTAAAAKVQKPTLITVKAKLETEERYSEPPPPHPYYTLICGHNRANNNNNKYLE